MAEAEQVVRLGLWWPAGRWKALWKEWERHRRQTQWPRVQIILRRENFSGDAVLQFNFGEKEAPAAASEPSAVLSSLRYTTVINRIALCLDAPQADNRVRVPPKTVPNEGNERVAPARRRLRRFGLWWLWRGGRRCYGKGGRESATRAARRDRRPPHLVRIAASRGGESAHIRACRRGDGKLATAPAPARRLSLLARLGTTTNVGWPVAVGGEVEGAVERAGETSPCGRQQTTMVCLALSCKGASHDDKSRTCGPIGSNGKQPRPPAQARQE